MKHVSWILGSLFLIFGAGCNLLNPTANQVTIEASNQYGNSCPVVANLDGNNTVTISNGSFYQFPLVGPGSHTLNFSTANPNPYCGANGTSCMYVNSGSSGANYSTTFNTTAGTIYVAAVTQSGPCNDLLVNLN